MKKKLLLMLSGVMLLCPASIKAADPTKDKPVTESAELSVVSANGNSRSTTTEAKNTLKGLWGKTGLETNVSGLGSRSNGQVTAEEYTADGKVSYNVTERNYVFEKNGWDKNRFAGIRNRVDLTTGLGRELVKTNANKLLLELGGGYVNEERVSGPRNDFASGRAYSRYEHVFTPTSTFSQDVEYLHDFSDRTDLRVNTETALTTALSAHFSFKTSYKWKHVGHPPAGFGKNDTITSVALIVNY